MGTLHHHTVGVAQHLGVAVRGQQQKKRSQTQRQRAGRPAQQLPQYRFAADIRADGGGTLLNYGTLDGGFYTVTGQLPPCKYFCVTNLPLAEQQQQQDALLAAGGVDYVVTLDAGLDSRFANCTQMDAVTYDGGEGPVTWYLYRVTA